MHPYTFLRVPKGAPFKLKPSPGKGYGAFATRRICRGELIIKEEALFVIRKPDTEITHDDVSAAFKQLSTVEAQQFSSLPDGGSHIYDSMRSTFAENSALLGTAGGSQAHGCFPLLSRINHSCLPNSHTPSSDEESISCFARRNIRPGEEITISYNPNVNWMTRHERHELLGFACSCTTCLLGTSFQTCSDMRRRLLRGLRYLSGGGDLDGVMPNGRHIIADPELRRAAEQCKIPLSSRLVYCILIYALGEVEGILDKIELENLKSDADLLASCFQTKSNVAVANLVIGQKTWMKKLDIAFRLYGKPDVTDDWISLYLANSEAIIEEFDDPSFGHLTVMAMDQMR